MGMSSGVSRSRLHNCRNSAILHCDEPSNACNMGCWKSEAGETVPTVSIRIISSRPVCVRQGSSGAHMLLNQTMRNIQAIPMNAANVASWQTKIARHVLKPLNAKGERNLQQRIIVVGGNEKRKTLTAIVHDELRPDRAKRHA